MSSDTLTTTSRAFFERTKLKLVASIVIGACGLMLLGFTAQAGGESASAGSQAKSRGVTDLTDDNIESSYNALAAGYGFATFAYIVGFFLLVGVAIYVSPILCGSPNEKNMVSKPQEVDSGSYSAYSERSPGSKV